MRGQIILVGGEKGGVGKSTISTNLAVALAHQGAETIIIDSDPQKTSINWLDRRNEIMSEKKLPVINGVSKDGNIRETIKSFTSKYDVIIVDASGRDSQSLRTGLTIADKFLCPIRASQPDLETLPHIVQLIQIAKDINESLKCYSVISMAPTNPMIDEVAEAQGLLRELNNHIHLLNTFIRDRKVYRDAMLSGKGVIELDNEKAKTEIQNLLKEVMYNG